MPLEQVQIQNLRILSQAEFEPAERLNFIIGANASGKTSILEAIHLLSVARSFRTRRVRDLLQRGTSEMVVRGSVSNQFGRSTQIAIQKDKSTTRLSIDGKRVQNSSALAGSFPLITFTPDSHVILQGGPKERRRLLDWTLFHVKRDYLAKWHGYYRALKQRNRLLQGRMLAVTELSAWEAEMVCHGMEIHAERTACVAALGELVAAYAERLGLGPVEMEYRGGWDLDLELSEALVRSRPTDLKNGTSSVGPHRADIRLMHKGQLATHKLSRGQSKLLIAALFTAQATRLDVLGFLRPTLLIDDFVAELDEGSKERLCDLIEDIGMQTFITATEPAVLPKRWRKERQSMFHVEQGRVTSVV